MDVLLLLLLSPREVAVIRVTSLAPEPTVTGICTSRVIDLPSPWPRPTLLIPSIVGHLLPLLARSKVSVILPVLVIVRVWVTVLPGRPAEAALGERSRP